MSPVPACRPLRPGQALADTLEVVCHVRRGADLDVYDAWSTRWRTRVVAKAIRPDRLDDARSVRDLRREGCLVTTLDHPHLVRGLEVLDDPLVVVLELLVGPTLDDAAATGRFSAVETAVLGAQLASALAHLHDHQVVHLDAKPGNVVLQAGQVKLIDLSLARPFGPAGRATGTNGHRAPEQERGGELDGAVDVWALGATLWEVAAGRSPTGGRPAPRRRRLAPLAAERPRFPRALCELVDACLAPDPASRPAAADLVDAFLVWAPA